MSMSLRVPSCTCGPEPVMHDGCDLCRRASHARAYRRLTPAQRAYDNYVDPKGAYHSYFAEGCSCHISPPCSYCVEKSIEDEAVDSAK